MAEIVNSNPTNEPHSKPIKTHSKFNPNYSLYQTPNFGLNTPVLALAGVGEDEISVRMNADIDTFSLKAPAMMPIKRSLDYFFLPMRALMPNSAELIITNPLRGDDVDVEDVNACLSSSSSSGFSGFLSTVGIQFNALANPSTPPSDQATFNVWLAQVLRWLQVTSRIFSTQSLSKQLGFSFDSLLVFRKANSSAIYEHFTYDEVFSVFISYLTERLSAVPGVFRDIYVTYLKPSVSGTTAPSITLTTVTKYYSVEPRSYATHYGSIADLVYDLFSSDLLVSTASSYYSSFRDSSNVWINPFKESSTSYYECLPASSLPQSLSVLRLVAYQKACAEFYTSDTVDDVYSAKLWEDNQRAWAYLMSDQAKPHYFKVNGILVESDSCAGFYLNRCFTHLTTKNVFTFTSPTNVAFSVWAYYCNVFSYTRSLRYQDYFVGSRVRPLAVGDVTVNVNSNKVDVVDVTKKIQVQRFLNQVNRVGRKFSDYMKGVLGSAPLPDAHEPLFLAHVVDTIGASEVTNTGSDQFSQAQSKTSNFRSNSSRYAFTIHVAEPGIIIGVQNFDIPRVYGTVTDRENYHLDRYQAFNPYMQFVGDQEVFKSELFPSSTGVFGYQQRYAEYKQRVSVASGGFLGYLPGYAKVLDKSWIDQLSSLEISSDFIRAYIDDLDEFYLQRYVTCPANSFHFIIRNDAEISAKRPMAFSPSIL